MQTNLSRSTLGRRFHDQINHDHRAIAAAIAAGDENAAAEEMHRHLAYLRPFYEKRLAPPQRPVATFLCQTFCASVRSHGGAR